MSIYRVEQKNLAKLSDTGSARARGLCIGSPRLVGGRKAGNLNMQEFFCTTLYSPSTTTMTTTAALAGTGAAAARPLP